MGMLNRLGKKNKKSKHYQKNYEEKQEEQINIRDNTAGIPKDVLNNREDYYEDVRKNITGTDKKRIRNIGRMSKNINDVFRRMEEEGLPLEYVVALGLAEEIDIESYQNMKIKGLDRYELEGKDEKEVDEDIKNEVLGYEDDMPEVIVDEDDEEEEEEEVTKGSRHIENFINMFKVNKKGTETDQALETEDGGNNNKQEKGNKKERRKIFVVGTDVEEPELDKYEVIKVGNMSQVTSFTSTRKDLLVVTRDVPKDIQKPLLEWFKGIDNTDRKYRMVTLKGYELNHSLVEDVIELTEESLDEYFDKFKDESYMSEDVGSFRDITDLLD